MKSGEQLVAFLRGINVGGNKLIKMSELTRVLTAAGFKNVRTFIASGNVIFDRGRANPARVANSIEQHLLKAFGHEITVVVRSMDELRKVVKLDPFKKVRTEKDVYLFVVLLASPPPRKPKQPFRSITDNLDVIKLTDGEAFIVARRKKTGWFGFPNNFIEKELGVRATTRNWSTLVRIVNLADKS